MKQNKEIEALKSEELEQVVGGEAATCTWDGKSYSEGSVVQMADGTKECKSDGKWH